MKFLLNLCQINILRTSRFALDDRCCFHFNLWYCYVHNFKMFIKSSQSSFSFASSFINFIIRKLLSTREQLNSRFCFFEFNNVVIVVLHIYLADPYGIYITRRCQVRAVSYSFQIVIWLFQNVLNISCVTLCVCSCGYPVSHLQLLYSLYICISLSLPLSLVSVSLSPSHFLHPPLYTCVCIFRSQWTSSCITSQVLPILCVETGYLASSINYSRLASPSLPS